MGRDLEDFVHPKRISSQLICPICTQVLENPVQTATEHLFCEEELLEWMTRSSQCPVTKRTIDPIEIKRPGRIVLNMLAELEVYCCHRTTGCQWTGPQELLKSHLERCESRPMEAVLRELADTKARVVQLESLVEDVERDKRALSSQLADAKFEKERSEKALELCKIQLQAFEEYVHSAMQAKSEEEAPRSDAERLRRLSALMTLKEDKSKKK